MAETNHDLSYMRSRDLRNWETVVGKPVRLPVSPDNTDVLVDPVPIHGGILNGSGKVGFDLDGKLVIAYHKFDKAGNTQLYFARPNAGRWEIVQASNWNYRWEIRGEGSLEPEITHGALTAKDGILSIDIRHIKEGNGAWSIDPETLTLQQKIASFRPDFVMPRNLRGPVSRFPGMKVQTVQDAGSSSDCHIYRLRWESLGINRDKPREKPWPEPAMLQIVGWKKH